MSNIEDPDASQADRNRARRESSGLWLLILVMLIFLTFAFLGRIA